MVDTRLTPGEALSERSAAPCVYYPEVAPLRLADGTPLYLDWIIEGAAGTLYRVPAEPQGWLRRTLHEGRQHKLRLVSPEDASIILRLTCAERDSELPPARYSLEYYRLQTPLD